MKKQRKKRIVKLVNNLLDILGIGLWLYVFITIVKYVSSATLTTTEAVAFIFIIILITNKYMKTVDKAFKN